MERVKEALRSTLDKVREQVETSHRNGKIPADYSLGFVNALIFTDHHINLRDGQPKFYERTTSIGTLPKPVALNSGNAIKDEQAYQFLQDETILKARRVLDSIQISDEKKTVDITEKTVGAISELYHAVTAMDLFVTQTMEAMEQFKNDQEAKKEQPKPECSQGGSIECPEEPRGSGQGI